MLIWLKNLLHLCTEKKDKKELIRIVKDKDGNEIDNQKTLFYQIYDNGAKSCTVGFKSVDAIEGVDLTSAEGILYGTVNSVVTGDKTVDEWYNAVIDAVKKYDK